MSKQTTNAPYQLLATGSQIKYFSCNSRSPSSGTSVLSLSVNSTIVDLDNALKLMYFNSSLSPDFVKNGSTATLQF